MGLKSDPLADARRALLCSHTGASERAAALLEALEACTRRPYSDPARLVLPLEKFRGPRWCWKVPGKSLPMEERPFRTVEVTSTVGNAEGNFQLRFAHGVAE